MGVLDSLWCPTSPSPALRVVFEQTREQTLTVHLYSGHDCDRSSTHVWKDQKGYTFGGRLVRALDPRGTLVVRELPVVRPVPCFCSSRLGCAAEKAVLRAPLELSSVHD